MSPQQLADFLARPLIARLATSEHDRPRVLPMWFHYDGTHIWLETSDTFPNARILRANPHAAIAIDESLGSFAFRAAIFRGTVEVIDHPADRVMDMVRTIYCRYLTDEEIASTEGEAILAAHHVLLRFTPTHTITWDTTGAI
jgi:nitroimidazol reductase NimA-like FMN-containing flavoprotein (pyridoxamine 5'-phosphate oxidase superfamily)